MTRVLGWLSWLKIPAILAILVVVWVQLHGHKSTEAATKAKPVKVVTVTLEPVVTRSVRRTVAVVGTLYGKDEITISPKVDGRVIRIYHDVGDTVKPGEVLLEIDPTDYQLAVLEAKRALDAELAKLGQSSVPDESFSVIGRPGSEWQTALDSARKALEGVMAKWGADSNLDITKLPSVAKAAAQERNAAAKFDRLQRSTSAASAEERGTAETELAVARSSYQQAVLDARATVASARQKQAALEIAIQRLKDTRIVAPACETAQEFAVCTRATTEGEMVRPSASDPTLFRLVVDRPLKLQTTVPERHRPEIQPGQPVELLVEAHPGEVFKGTVSRVNPTIDRASRTFKVEVLVPNTDRRLAAGSFAKAEILTQTEMPAKTVPEEALVSFAGVTKVFTAPGDTAREVHVRAAGSVIVNEGGRHRTWRVIEGDIAAGTQVVTSGQTQLAEGVPLKVRSQN